MNANAQGDQIDIPLPYWVAFFVLVVVLLGIDLFFHRKERRIGIREAAAWTSFYVFLAVLFNVWIYLRFGAEPALLFTTGYLIEEALSVDNIFVFVIIFRYFRVKPEFQHRILFWGILGAIVMRLLFILAGVTLIERFHFTIYILGAFLVATGIKLLFQKEEDIDPARNWALRLFKRYIPTTTEFEGARFIVKRNGRAYATPLLLVLVVVESTDLVFAVDSVPAIIAITTNKFIVYTSNIFAILGLRSLYFLLAGMMDAFRFLKVGLSLVLVFIGALMVVPKSVVDLPIGVKLGVIAGLLSTAVVISLVLPGRGVRGGGEECPPREGGEPRGGE